MRITEQQRKQIEDRIRAATERLLLGELPPGGKCDVKTLAAEAGVTRAALYSTYLQLKEDFERRRNQLRAAGTIPDPREGQIVRLKERIDTLMARINDQDSVIAELTAFRALAVSRLAAQHEEIGRLRDSLIDQENIRVLTSARQRRSAETASP
ncbi:hypothetical protein [Mycobacteroides abscessus]|uniref:hypothetical protein n=1 Tax=Mycobacteroides abscessus TaxID=36809 RepID=UPI000C2599A6|nr:hypothetical protein [Mycobacteroides abscessus]